MVNQLLVALVNSVLGPGKPTARGNQAHTCPFCHHHKPKLEINLSEGNGDKNPWHCWVCGKKGVKLITLFKQIGAPEDKLNELRALVKSSYKDEQIQTQEEVKLPDEFKPLSEITENDIIGRHALIYLKKRGITKADILRYNIGYCEGGKYDKMIIVPSYDEFGKLNYFVARNFNSNSPVKYKNPPIGKNIIPFELFINWSSPLILCEGPFDAISIKRNAVPLLGKHIQPNLMKRIVTSQVEKVYIALDKDAQKDALKFAELLLAEGKEVYIVDMDEKDPNEMGFEHFTKLIQETYPTNTFDLMSRKIELI
jgi:DNA primase